MNGFFIYDNLQLLQLSIFFPRPNKLKSKNPEIMINLFILRSRWLCMFCLFSTVNFSWKQQFNQDKFSSFCHNSDEMCNRNESILICQLVKCRQMRNSPVLSFCAVFLMRNGKFLSSTIQNVQWDPVTAANCSPCLMWHLPQALLLLAAALAWKSSCLHISSSRNRSELPKAAAHG